MRHTHCDRFLAVCALVVGVTLLGATPALAQPAWMTQPDPPDPSGSSGSASRAPSGAAPSATAPSTAALPTAAPSTAAPSAAAPAASGPAPLRVEGTEFVTADGTPFFWLGDTAWSLFVNLDRAEVVEYLDDRADKGFTVIQAVAVSPPSGGLGPNAQGDRPYADAIDEPAVTDGADPDDATQYDYWDHVEFTVTEAARRGMYVALLPAWSEATAGESLTSDNAEAYGRFLGTRFGRAHDNLIWMAGGDDNEGFFPEIWGPLASGIAEGATGRDDQDAILMGYHPGGGRNSASELGDEPWLDFNTHQSGHGPLAGNGGLWSNVALSREAGIPFLDSEPAYEEHPIDFDASNGYTTALDVRQYAYSEVFAGAAGHTYGHHNVWMMYGTENGGEGADPKDIDWREALDSPGAQQMSYFARLMAEHPGPRVTAQNLLGGAEEEGDDVVATRAADGSYALVYTGEGRPFSLDTPDGFTASWFDPRTGESSAAEPEGTTWTPPTEEEDWVLVVDRSGTAAPAAAPTTAPASSEAEPVGAEPVRVMPLGDSITYGYEYGSYRTALYAALTEAGAAVDFVGSQNDGPDDLPDADHEGHTGLRVDELAEQAPGWVAEAGPQVVLLHAGTNDLLQGDAPDVVAERLDALLDTLFAADPQLTVITASLVPLDGGTAEWRALNAAIPGIVETQRAAGHDARFADMGTVDPADVPDDVHPGPEGYAAMARAWYAPLLEALTT